MSLILSKDKFPDDIGGGLESDLTFEKPIDGFGKWSVAIANKTRLTKAESEEFRLKLQELTGLKWERDSVSSFVFHYVPNSKEKTMSKKKASEGQMALIEVGPKNLKEIVKEVRIYKRHQRDRLTALKLEVAQKEKIKALVKEAELQRLKGGEIKFEADNAIICVAPQDDLITIKEKTPKKSKKGKGAMGAQVESEEQQHEKKK